MAGSDSQLLSMQHLKWLQSFKKKCQKGSKLAVSELKIYDYHVFYKKKKQKERMDSPASSKY